MTVTFGNVLEKSYVIDQACIKYIVAARTNVTLFNNVVIKIYEYITLRLITSMGSCYI